MGKLPEEVRAYLAKIGSKGGKRGGPARAKKLSPEERSRIGREGAQARWRKMKDSESGDVGR